MGRTSAAAVPAAEPPCAAVLRTVPRIDSRPGPCSEPFCGPEASGPAETDLLVEMVVAELLARALGLDPEALQEGE